MTREDSILIMVFKGWIEAVEVTPRTTQECMDFGWSSSETPGGPSVLREALNAIHVCLGVPGSAWMEPERR